VRQPGLRKGRRKQSLPTRVDNSSATGVFGAEEAVGWAVSRQMIEPGQRAPRSQSVTRAPLRPDAIDRTVRLTARAPPPLSTENAGRRAGAPLARRRAGRTAQPYRLFPRGAPGTGTGRRYSASP